MRIKTKHINNAWWKATYRAGVLFDAAIAFMDSSSFVFVSLIIIIISSYINVHDIRFSLVIKSPSHLNGITTVFSCFFLSSFITFFFVIAFRCCRRFSWYKFCDATTVCVCVYMSIVIGITRYPVSEVRFILTFFSLPHLNAYMQRYIQFEKSSFQTNGEYDVCLFGVRVARNCWSHNMKNRNGKHIKTSRILF